MNLRDRNLRFALLKAIADTITDELAAERTAHTLDLRERYDDDGVKSMDVKLPNGVKVASISLAIPKGGMAIIDEAAFLAWAIDNAPTAVHEQTYPAEPERVVEARPERTEHTLDRTVADGLLKVLRPIDAAGGEVIDPTTGLVVDGVTYTPEGTPRSFSVRYADEGKDALATAYRAGELGHLIAGTVLPEVTA